MCGVRELAPAFLSKHRRGIGDPDPIGTAYSLVKSFSCNTYVLPHKCCKQKTYISAKPFSCNTYKKWGWVHTLRSALAPS
jgi:hypothetical protein